MARRRKGLDISGWVIVDKPSGIGSTEVVSRVRRAHNARKAGHAGTLDPAATGVLAVALGEATKTIPFVTDALKGYRFMVRFGQATSTDDAEGTVIAESDLRPQPDAIEAALPAFRGRIMQVPPQVSAVKVDGARAYDLARDGATPELAARPLWVDRLAMIGCPAPDQAELEMVCGKGGYVRAIARDLGAALGGCAHVVWLRRTWSGPFDALRDGISLDALDTGPPAPLPLEAGLVDLPRLTATEAGAARLRNGNPGEVTGPALDFGSPAWATRAGVPLAVGIYRGGLLHPNRVFNLEAP